MMDSFGWMRSLVVGEKKILVFPVRESCVES